VPQFGAISILGAKGHHMAKKMKAVVAESLGSLEDLQLVDVDRPLLQAGHVLVRVQACSIGYVDALLALGKYQVTPPLPHTPGQEIGGIVEEVGEGVSDLKAGDRVFCIASKGLAEYACVRAEMVMPIPGDLSFSEAACLPINYLTALHGLRDRAQLVDRETVLVFGAAGGLGSAGIHISKAIGAHVIAVASTEEKRKFALANGADACIETNLDGWRPRLEQVAGGKKLDVIFDPVCGPLFEHAFRSLAWRGRHLVLGFAGGAIPSLPANLTLMKGASLIGVDVRQYMMLEGHRLKADLRQLADWIEDGQFKPIVGPEYPLGKFSDALTMAFSGQVLGKTVVNCQLSE
jgi:NADPH2:quinone reductase